MLDFTGKYKWCVRGLSSPSTPFERAGGLVGRGELTRSAHILLYQGGLEQAEGRLVGGGQVQVRRALPRPAREEPGRRERQAQGRGAFSISLSSITRCKTHECMRCRSSPPERSSTRLFPLLSPFTRALLSYAVYPPRSHSTSIPKYKKQFLHAHRSDPLCSEENLPRSRSCGTAV